MKFLVDNAVSPKVAEGLRKIGHDAVHVREIGLRDAPDEVIFALAVEQSRIILSADIDFTNLLAESYEKKPSVVLIRRHTGRSSHRQLNLLSEHLPALEQSLLEGAVVVLEDGHIRVRLLPIADQR